MVMGSLIPGSEQVPQIAIDVGARGVGAELFLQREDGLLVGLAVLLESRIEVGLIKRQIRFFTPDRLVGFIHGGMGRALGALKHGFRFGCAKPGGFFRCGIESVLIEEDLELEFVAVAILRHGEIAALKLSKMPCQLEFKIALGQARL